MSERHSCRRFIAPVALGSLLVFVGSACSAPTRVSPPQAPVVRYVAEPAPVPAGVVRMCWEEPMVKFEENGPGLDAREEWYHPRYVAVRQVRAGKWRPCEPVPAAK